MREPVLRRLPWLGLMLASVLLSACPRPPQGKAAAASPEPQVGVAVATTSKPGPAPTVTVDVPACGGAIAVSETELYCDLTGGVVIDPAVVEPLVSVQKVSFDTDPADVGFLAALVGVEEISFDQGVSADLSPLRELPRLRKLAILGPAPRVETLEGLSTLMHLDLTRAEIGDLGPLTTNTELVDLVMLWTDVPDISPIGKFTKLERLQLQPPSSPNHEEAIVDPHWKQRVDSLDFFEELQHLEEAHMDGLRLEHGCRGLKKARALRSLVLEKSGPCQSFAVIADLEHLEHAELSRTRFVDADLGDLTGVPALSSLSLDGTGVEDVSPLSKLESLRFLHFVPKTGRQRRSVEKLRGMKSDIDVSR